MTIKSLATVLMGVTMLTTTLTATFITTPAFSVVSSDIVVTRTTQREPLTGYIGGAFGNADYNKANDSDVGFSIYGGIKPWRLVAFEFAYVNLGKPSLSPQTKEEVTLFRTGVVAIYQLRNGQLKGGFSIFGQSGLALWDKKTTGLTASSDSGTDLYVGMGAILSLGGGSNLRFAFDYYPLNSDLGAGDEDITFLYIGFQQGF